MKNAIFYVSYKLKKGASVPDFLQASKRLNDEYISKQKGYISWQQLYDEKKKTWADFCVFETMEDVKNFVANSKNPGELSKKFYSFMNFFSCKVHYYTIERDYNND